MKNMIHDRVRFNRGSWTIMLSKALDKYNDTVHSSTKMKPKDAHDDKNHMDVRVNLTKREKNTRKYPEVKVNDMVKVFEKKKDNYTERKEYNSKVEQSILQNHQDRIRRCRKQNLQTGGS